MDIEGLKKALIEVVDSWFLGEQTAPSPANELGNRVDEIPTRELPKGKRVVRTKSSGDRVYLLDEVKKTRQWVTTGEILDSIGFSMADVNEVDDAELLRYAMASPIYKVPE